MQFIHSQDDVWQRVGGEDGPQPHPKPRANALLSWEQWHAVRDTWPQGLSVGVILPNTVDVEDITDDLPRLSLLALQFPKWTDGRAYSQAHVLRARLRFKGEVRAIGEVLVDMMPLLHRAGFNTVQLRPDQREASARRALSIVTENYQGDVHATRPAFARTAA